MQTKRFDIDRDFARSFVDDRITEIEKQWPHLLLQQSDYRAGDGITAIVEIVMEIKASIERKKGRPQYIDPIQAYEKNQNEKKNHQRASFDTANYKPSDLTHERLSKELGISKNTLYKEIKKGHDASLIIEEAISTLPLGIDPVAVKVDYDAKTVELIAVPRRISERKK